MEFINAEHRVKYYQKAMELEVGKLARIRIDSGLRQIDRSEKISHQIKKLAKIRSELLHAKDIYYNDY